MLPSYVASALQIITQLEDFIRKNKVDEAVFAYSDISHEELMHRACRANAAGADFKLVSPTTTQITAKVPLIAVLATRTGCGKSQVSRAACRWFTQHGYRVVAIREPMPYGNLCEQKCMRFSAYKDFEEHGATIEEREEYEPYVEQGLVVYSGVDYEAIVREAEKEADVIIWDGGNNEVSFYKPDLNLCVCDPLRPGDELKYFPGELNVRSADCFVVNKVNVASNEDVQAVTRILDSVNPKADRILTNSEVSCSEEHRLLIEGKRCIVLEDGPTTTHGNMSFGAGTAAAKKYGGKIADVPKSALRGSMVEVFTKFPHLKNIVPAMGYTEDQRKDLTSTLNAIPDGDVIINGSPLDLQRLLPELKLPVARVTYDITPFKESKLTFEDKLDAFVKEFMPKQSAK